jgi:hypothetical protein
MESDKTIIKTWKRKSCLQNTFGAERFRIAEHLGRLEILRWQLADNRELEDLSAILDL